MKKPLASYLLTTTLLIFLPSLTHGWELFGSEFSKPTKLHRAAERGDIATIKKWISKGRNLDVKYNDPGPRNWHEGAGAQGQTALMFAARSGQFEAVRLLVNAGANIYQKAARPGNEGYGSTVFDYAVEGGNPEIVKYLWEMSDKKRFTKKTPLNLLISYDDFCSRQPRPAARDLVVFLIDNVASEKLASEALWRISGRSYCIEEIRFLLQRGVTPAPSAVVTASSLGQSDIVSLYLKWNADINALGRSSATKPLAKVTPLIAAARKAKSGIVRLLLVAGADANKQDTQGRTALIAAVAEGGGSEYRLEVMKLLLQYNAQKDIKDRFGKTAFDYADRHSSDPYSQRKKAILSGKNKKIGPDSVPRLRHE